jgi:hypothetical protein
VIGDETGAAHRIQGIVGFNLDDAARLCQVKMVRRVCLRKAHALIATFVPSGHLMFFHHRAICRRLLWLGLWLLSVEGNCRGSADNEQQCCQCDV